MERPSEATVDDRTALFANVMNQPAEDAARLVLADWLEEHGEGEFGQFLRAGVAAARFRGGELIDDPDYYDALRVIAAVSAGGAPAQWLAALGVGPSPLTESDWVWDNAADRVTVRIGSVAGVYARGMLCELGAPLSEWYRLAAPALADWPLERVMVTDVPGLSFTVGPAEGGWRLRGRLRLPRRQVPLTDHFLPSAVGPRPVLTEAAEWAADQFFADRAALAEGAARESAAIVEDLKDAAGDLWPRRTRR